MSAKSPFTTNLYKIATVLASDSVAVFAFAQAKVAVTFFALSAALFFASCGDSASSPFAPESSGESSAIGDCNEWTNDFSVFSPKNKTQYNCKNGKWEISRIEDSIGGIYYSKDLMIIPNDPAPQDSLNYRLSSGGTFMKLVPNVEYTLSFDSLEGESPTLNLYRDYTKDFSVKATDSAGRYYYHFSLSGKNDSSLYFYHITLTDSNEKVFEGPTKNARLTTAMGPFSTHFSVNLIVTGPYTSTTDNLTEQEFIEKLKKRFDQAFDSSGIFIDKLNVFHAKDHPTYGEYFDFRGPYQMPDNYYHVQYQMLKTWPKHENALNIILGYRIEANSAIAFSTKFGGTLNGEANGSPFIVASTAHNSQKIATSIVHEIGHFLGLRHTTSTTRNMETDLDQSNTHDGIEDTPNCGTILEEKSAKNDCDDQSNIMYPYPSATLNQEFSEKQFEIMKKNLSITPH